jgi:hypothetical protein
MSATKADLVLLSSKNGQGYPGSRKANVAVSATLIYPGEPVIHNALGDVVVVKMATNSPIVATHFLDGIASTLSTNSAALAGKVDVVPVNADDIWLIRPNVAGDWDTQAKYDAIVGKRVLIDLSAGGAYTLLSADDPTYGCVVQPLDITKYPNWVAISFRKATNYLA